MNCADCLPLKIGDEAYILRQQSGTGLTIRHGVVSEINITHQHRRRMVQQHGYAGNELQDFLRNTFCSHLASSFALRMVAAISLSL